MAIKADKVVTIIQLKGQDRASRSINKASKSMGRLRSVTARAQGKMRALGGAARAAMSGDVLGAVNGFSGAIGSLAGPAGVMAGATAGVAALGAAALATGVKMTRMLEPIERFRVQARAAFEGGEQAALRFADAIGGVNVKSVVQFRSQLKAAGIDTQFTTKQLQNLTNTAARVGKTGDDALTALAMAIENGNTRALKSVGIFVNASRLQDEYARSVGKTTTQLTQQEKQQLVVDELQRRLQKEVAGTTTVWAQQDAELARLDNAYERLKLNISEAVSPAMLELTSIAADLTAALAGEGTAAARAHTDALADLAAQSEVVTQAGYRLAASQVEQERAIKASLAQVKKLGRVRRVEGFVGSIEGRRTTPSRRRRTPRRTPRISAGPQRDEVLERARAAAAAGDRIQQDVDKMLAAQERALRLDEDLAMVRARLNGLTGDALAKLRIETQLQRELREIQGGEGSEKDAELARLRAAAELREIERARRTEATEERLEQERRLAEAQQRAIELERTRRMESITTAQSIIGGAAALAQSSGLLEKNDKLQRAILASRSIADAARETALAAGFAASGNVPQAIAHGLAATAHGVAAARYRSSGSGGRSSATPTTPGPSAGNADSLARGRPGRSGGDVVINTGPGFLIATPAQLAAEIGRLQLAGAGTGL